MSGPNFIQPPPSPKVPEETQARLQEEERLWAEVVEDAGNEEKHKQYFNYTVRHSLLKEASRRYGPMINAKDAYSVEARRQFRKYQQTIVNLMFMGNPRNITEKKNPAAEYFIFILATLLIIAGILIWQLRIALLIGLATMAVLIFFKIRSVRSAKNENRTIPE